MKTIRKGSRQEAMLKREKCTAKTKYGSTCTWLEYSASPANKKKISEVLKKNK